MRLLIAKLIKKFILIIPKALPTSYRIPIIIYYSYEAFIVLNSPYYYSFIILLIYYQVLAYKPSRA